MICPDCGSTDIKISAGYKDALLKCKNCGNEGLIEYQ